MGIKTDRFLTSELFISFLYRLSRAYSWTFNLKVENEKEWMDYLANGGAVLLCGWHQQFFSAIRYFQNYRIFNPAIMISQSKDGELVAGVAKRSGWNPVRGSSSRGGREALKKEDFDNAIKYFLKVVDILPSSGAVVLNLADLYFLKKDYETARKYAALALELGEKSAASVLEKINAVLAPDLILQPLESNGEAITPEPDDYADYILLFTKLAL